jgi:hypothetical protein
MIHPREIKDFPSLHDTPDPVLPDDNFFYRPYIGDSQTLTILDLLYRLKPKACLEYGSGFSTVFFASLIQCPWISIEHHPYFHKAIQQYLPPNVISVNEEIWASNDWYIRAGERYFRDYDFVFVDGERREQCVAFADSIMRKGGVIIKHDSGDIDVPIPFNDVDVRCHYKQHGVINGLWWGIK